MLNIKSKPKHKSNMASSKKNNQFRAWNKNTKRFENDCYLSNCGNILIVGDLKYNLKVNNDYIISNYADFDDWEGNPVFVGDIIET